MLLHLEEHKIVSDLQHGFRSGHSCGSQLIITFNDLYEAYNYKQQADVIIFILAKHSTPYLTGNFYIN